MRLSKFPLGSLKEFQETGLGTTTHLSMQFSQLFFVQIKIPRISEFWSDGARWILDFVLDLLAPPKSRRRLFQSDSSRIPLFQAITDAPMEMVGSLSLLAKGSLANDCVNLSEVAMPVAFLTTKDTGPEYPPHQHEREFQWVDLTSPPRLVW